MNTETVTPQTANSKIHQISLSGFDLRPNEKFAGVCLEEGEGYYLLLSTTRYGELHWEAVKKLIASTGLELPSFAECQIMAVNLPRADFEEGMHWIDEPVKRADGEATVFEFEYRHTDRRLKVNSYFVRLIRRVPIDFTSR